MAPPPYSLAPFLAKQTVSGQSWDNRTINKSLFFNALVEIEENWEKDLFKGGDKNLSEDLVITK